MTGFYGIALPICLLFVGSIILFVKAKTICTLLQLLGASCLMVVLLVHVAEAFHLFPSMNWGMPKSTGHYLDFWSAVLGVVLFPVGYLCHAIRREASDTAGD